MRGILAIILKTGIILLEEHTPSRGLNSESEAMHIRTLPRRVIKKLYLLANACHCYVMPSMPFINQFLHLSPIHNVYWPRL
jgi:hypothetical protein